MSEPPIDFNSLDTAVHGPVRLGVLYDGLREITEGLNPGDQIIVVGMQQVRPGMTVEP